MDKFNSSVDSLYEEYERSDEQFIKSFKDKYSNPLPPSWMILELSSFGCLSRIYKNLKSLRPKRNIANYFQLDETTFESWLHTLVYIRNVCAHHARLWNRKMSIAPKIPFNPRRPWINNTVLPNPIAGNPNLNNNDSTYYLLCIVMYLLFIINPKTKFKDRLLSLFGGYPNIDLKAMGLPETWQLEPLWKR
jgi:abortive infection bacteriophage resistance protein